MRYTKRAQQEIAEIDDYVAERSGDDVALDLIDRIYATCLMLDRHPLAGHARPELGARKRSYPVGDYTIVYRPMRSGIEVSRVSPGRGDPAKLLHKKKR